MDENDLFVFVQFLKKKRRGRGRPTLDEAALKLDKLQEIEKLKQYSSSQKNL